MTHLGDRVSALVDGELGHEARERALAHVAHCADCRAELAAERAVKGLLAARQRRPRRRPWRALQSLAEPGGPLPPRARTMPQGPVVPDLPPPGRVPRGAQGQPAPRRVGARRRRVLTAGALSAAGLVLATAFVAGGTAASGGPVVPPVAELSVEHSRTRQRGDGGGPRSRP